MTTTLPTRHYFPGLKSSTYEHPEDRRLLEALRKLKGFDQIVKLYHVMKFEAVEYALNLSNNVRVTPRQYPRLYRLYKQAVEALDVHEPELYVENDRSLNAYTKGSRHPYVVVTTGLLETMSETEMQWVLAHELGHVKSGHVLYGDLGKFLAGQLVRVVPGVVGNALERLVKAGLPLALTRWQRFSEYTADRAGHLVCGDPEVGVRVLLKLAGGYANHEPPSVQEFLRQAEDFRAVEGSLLGKAALVFGGSLWASHPYPAVRARELLTWHGDPLYRRILEGRDERSANATCNPLPVACAHCGHPNTGERELCERCRTPLPERIVVSGRFERSVKERCRACNGWHDNSDLYCIGCGERLLHTYFAPGDSGQGSPAPLSRSTLPGGLGVAVNEALGPDEVIVFEVEGESGEGLTCTSERLLISKAGLSAGGLRARKVHAFPFGEATEIDHVVGRRHVRVQIDMQGYRYPDRDPARVDDQYGALSGEGNVCHLPVGKRVELERFLTRLEEAFQTDDPNAALAGMVVSAWDSDPALA